MNVFRTIYEYRGEIFLGSLNGITLCSILGIIYAILIWDLFLIPGLLIIGFITFLISGILQDIPTSI